MGANFIFQTLFSGLSLAVLATSFLACLVIVVTERMHRARSARVESVMAVQALHRFPVPRIGGLAVLAGVAVAVVTSPLGWVGLGQTACIALPMVVLGLDEDLGGSASPRERLLAVALSTAIAVALLGFCVTRTGIALLDLGLANSAFALGFTLLLVVGTSHAFNIIDGLNGLSTGFAVFAALSLAGLAIGVEDFGLAAIVLLTIPALLGFFVWNFPHGRLFLGDAGAYSIGFMMVWAGIALLHRHPELSPWAVFLVFLWPISETLLSMGRRAIRRHPLSSADTGHVHHLVYRAVCRLWPALRPGQANPIAAVLVLVPASVPMIVGISMPMTAGAGEVALLIAIFVLVAFLLQGLVAADQRRSAASAADSGVKESRT